VEHDAALEARDHPPRSPRADQHRPRRLEALDRRPVARLDPLVPVRRDQQADLRGVAVGRRRPVHGVDRHRLLPQGVGHQVEPGGGDP
jgi:hypothetical protein